MLIQALTVSLPILWLGTALLHGMSYAGPHQPPWTRTAQRASLATSLLLHAGLFVAHWQGQGEFPIQGLPLTLSAVAFCTALLFTQVTLRAPQPTVGSIIFAAVVLLQWLASALGPVSFTGLRHESEVSILHILMMLAASASLVLSGLYGALFLLHYRQVQRRSFGLLFKNLPSLEHLAATVRRAALAGFLCLTVGLNVGIGLGHAQEARPFRYGDPQVVLVMALWIHFGLIAFSRRIPGLNARRASLAAILGLLTLLLAISLMALPGLHGHGA